MKKTLKYKVWSQNEIQRLVDLCDWYRGAPIDWAKVSDHFPERSSSQCKSFYYNQMRNLGFRYDGQQNVVYTSRPFTEYVYLFWITGFVAQNESHDAFVRRSFAQCCIENGISMLPLLMARTWGMNYSPNVKLLAGTLRLVELHAEWGPQIQALFAAEGSPDSVQFHGFTIEKHKFAEFSAFWATQRVQELTDCIKVSLEGTTLQEEPQ